MGFSQTFLQGFQVGSQKKLQQEAQMRQAERDKQQAALDLEELKLRQGAARIADQKARFDADLHPLELEKAIQEAGLVPADVAGGAPGGGAAAGPLPPPAALGQPSGASPSAPTGVGTGDASPEPAPRTMSDILNIGGKSFRRKTLKERMDEAEGVAGAKAGAEARAKAQYDYLPQDVTVQLPGGPVTIPKGTPLNVAPTVVSGTTSARVSAADNATSRENAKTAAEAAAARGRLKVRNVPGVGLVLEGDVQDALTRGGPGVEAGPDGVNRLPASLPATTKHVIDKGIQTLKLRDHITELLADPQVQAGLGPVAGRITSLKQLAGIPDPKVQELAASLSGFMALAQGIHGFRSAEMAEHLFNTYSGARFTPEAIAAAVKGMSQVAEGWAELGKQHGYEVGASSPGAAPGAAPPSGIVIKSIRPKN